MKNLTKIFVFFALIILFASSANAQFIPTIGVYNACDEIPGPTESPSGWCQYWRSFAACRESHYSDYGWKVVSESGGGCTVTSDIGMNGSWHYYNSGDKFCSENNIGTPRYSKTCVARTDIVQPIPIPKLEPAPGFQPLLEKSETQLEIERKNKQLEQELEQSNQELGQKVQEQYQKDRAAGLIKDEETYYGSPTILRGGKIVSFKPGFNINPGDVVETGDGSTAQLISASGAIYLKKGGTTVEFLGFRDNKAESESLTTLEYVKSELKSFAQNCSSGDYSACKEYTATIVRNGDVFFSEKMRDTFPNGVLSAWNEKLPHGIVASITAIAKGLGTEFGVTVALDGATTVTTLEGSVLVMDIVSKQSVLVGANESITIPKSTKGLTEAELQQRINKIDPSSIDKWWERSIFEQITTSLDSTKIIIILGVFAFIVLIIKRRKQIWPNKFAALPADKEENKNIVNDNYKWLVDNSFAAGAFSTMLSFYLYFVSPSSQSMSLLKNYWQIFLIVAIIGLIFGLLGIKSPRKAFVYNGILFNIIAIILWFKIGMVI